MQKEEAKLEGTKEAFSTFGPETEKH